MVKRIFIVVTVILTYNVAYGQCEDSLEYVGVSIADEMPATLASVIDSIQKYIVCPDTLIEEDSNILVVVSFWIDTSGNTFCHKIERSYSKKFDNEAIRAAKRLKFDNPALNKKKPVSIMYTVPVRFNCCKNKNPYP